MEYLQKSKFDIGVLSGEHPLGHDPLRFPLRFLKPTRTYNRSTDRQRRKSENGYAGRRASDSGNAF
jgi:hypothetical protein